MQSGNHFSQPEQVPNLGDRIIWSIVLEGVQNAPGAFVAETVSVTVETCSEYTVLEDSIRVRGTTKNMLCNPVCITVRVEI